MIEKVPGKRKGASSIYEDVTNCTLRPPPPETKKENGPSDTHLLSSATATSLLQLPLLPVPVDSTGIYGILLALLPVRLL